MRHVSDTASGSKPWSKFDRRRKYGSRDDVEPGSYSARGSVGDTSCRLIICSTPRIGDVLPLPGSPQMTVFSPAWILSLKRRKMDGGSGLGYTSHARRLRGNGSSLHAVVVSRKIKMPWQVMGRHLNQPFIIAFQRRVPRKP